MKSNNDSLPTKSSISCIALLGLIACGLLAQSQSGHAQIFQGFTSDDWATASNWNNNAVPTSPTVVAISGATTPGHAVIHNGTSASTGDLSIFSDIIQSSGGPSTLTVASGGMLSVTEDLDMGFSAGLGASAATLNIQSGGIVTVAGYFIDNNSAPVNTGAVNISFAGSLSVGGVVNLYSGVIFNYTLEGTGLWTLTGDDTTVINDAITAGFITDRGVAFGDAGWGTTHGINVNFDGLNTNVTNVPEPSTYGLLILSLGVVLWSRHATRRSA